MLSRFTCDCAGIRKDCATTTPDEIAWDRYYEEWNLLLLLAERVCNIGPAASRGSKSASQHFTVDFSVVSPLYDTARVCRYPLLRRRAIHILRAYPCQGGLWNSLLAARAAER